jgi:sec-independent protein translocase protein TatA
MFGMGYAELLIIGLLGVLLFGHRLPKVMRDLGHGITEFKRGMHDTDDDREGASSED